MFNKNSRIRLTFFGLDLLLASKVLTNYEFKASYELKLYFLIMSLVWN